MLRYKFISILLVISLQLLATKLLAQYQINKLNSYHLARNWDSLPKSVISSDFTFSIASNFISNQLYNEFFEGEVTKNTLIDVSNALEENNIQLQLIDLNINFKTLISNSLYLTIYGRSHNFRYTNFSEDFGKLLLQGNAPFEGEKLELLGTEYLSFRYQSIAAGVEKKFKNTILGASISLIKSSYLSETSLQRGSLYTYEYGTQIDLDVDYSSHKSLYVESNDLLNIAGWGTNLNLYAAHQTEFGTFGIEIDNLGFISYSNQEKSTTDTLIAYRGIDLINGGSTSLQLSSEIDELLNLQTTKFEKTYHLPVSYHFNYSNHFANERIYLNTGLHYLSQIYNLPQFYTTVGYDLIKSSNTLRPSLLLSYGGFGELDWGIGLTGTFNDFLYVNIQTTYLQQFMTPQSSNSFGFNISSSIRF